MVCQIFKFRCGEGGTHSSDSSRATPINGPQRVPGEIVAFPVERTEAARRAVRETDLACAPTGISELVRLIASDTELCELGVEVDVNGHGVVGVFHRGHCRGVWQWDGMAYEWTPVAQLRPVCRLSSAADAAHFTALTFKSAD